MFVFKLVALYQSLMTLKNKFPQVQADAVALYSDVEAAIASKEFSIGAVRQVVTDIEHAVSDFADSWAGSQTEWDAFLASVKAM